MKRTVDSGFVVAIVAARLVLIGAVATTLTVFAQIPEAYAGCGNPALHAQFKNLREQASQVPSLAERQKIQEQINTLGAALRASQVSINATQKKIKAIQGQIQRARATPQTTATVTPPQQAPDNRGAGHAATASRLPAGGGGIQVSVATGGGGLNSSTATRTGSLKTPASP